MTREPSGRKFDAEAETRKTCVNGKDASEVEDHHPEGLGRERTAFEVEALGEIGVVLLWREQPEAVQEGVFFQFQHVIEVADAVEAIERDAHGDRESSDATKARGQGRRQ